jgi:hypothetical protein
MRWLRAADPTAEFFNGIGRTESFGPLRAAEPMTVSAQFPVRFQRVREECLLASIGEHRNFATGGGNRGGNYSIPCFGPSENQSHGVELDSVTLAALRRVEARGTIETAHRTKSVCSRVFRYAIATGRAERDVAPAGWGSEVDLEGALWRIPAERMKAREAHLVPLSRQAVQILNELKPVTGGGRLLFPSLRSQERPISNNTLNAALRRLGTRQTRWSRTGSEAWPPRA